MGDVDTENDQVDKDNSKQERYVQIKLHQTEINGRIEFVIQIIDFSLNIINKKIQLENQVESMIRGTVCHEIQNPLNSIINANQLIQVIAEDLNKVNLMATQVNLKISRESDPG